MTITELADATGVSKHTLRYIRAYARLVAKGDSTWDARKAMLATHRARVAATITRLQQHRAMLDRKLSAGCAPGDLNPRAS